MRSLPCALALLLAGGMAAAQPAPATQPVAAPASQPADSVTFQTAIRLALRHNPTAEIAHAEIERAQAIVREVRAAILPVLSGNVVYTRLDSDRVLGGSPPRVVAAANQLNAAAVATVPIVSPKAYVAWRHAQQNVDVVGLGAADVGRQVALATARAYLTVVSLRRAVEVTTRARDTAQAHYDFAHARFRGGVGNRIDEVRAAQETSTDEAQLQTAAANLDRAREALGVLVAGDHPVDAADEPDLPSPPALAEADNEALHQRADVRSAHARLALAEKVLEDSWADYLPSLSATIQAFYQNPASLTTPVTGWSGLLTLSIPFYDGGLRTGQKRERAALVAEAQASVEAAERQALAEGRSAYQAAVRAEAALAAAREASRLGHEALDMATLAYRTGTITNLEVIDAERRARDTDEAAVVAEDNARQARLDLLSAVGLFP